MIMEDSHEEMERLKQGNPQLSQLFNREKLLQPIKDVKEKEELIKGFIYLKGLVKHHIDSFNQFINHDVQKIIKAKSNNRILSDVESGFYLQYNSIRVGMPTVEENFQTFKLHPQECRISDLNYSGNIYVNIEFSLNNKVFSKKDIIIGKMPIMLGSTHCHLFGKSEKDLQKMKECPYDPRGYFIIRGTEKVALIQEQMAKNRIIIEKDSKTKQILASVACDTLDTKSRLEVRVKNGKVYCKSNSFTELIPIFIMFKAMGVESESQIFQLVGNETEFNEWLSLSLEDSCKLSILTQEEALEWIGLRLRLSRYQTSTTKLPQEEAREVLSNIVLAHVGCKKYDFTGKVIYLSIMIRGVLLGQKNSKKLDDKDYYGNKRLECAGYLLGLLFEDKLKVFNSELKKQIDRALVKRKSQEIIDVTSFMKGNDIITNGVANAISSGNWSIKRFKMERQGVTQVLSRLTYIGALGMMTRISSQIEKTMKISGPRALQGSHWGIICPSDTPDGESCGLVKNLALLTYITTEQNQKQIIKISKYLGVEDIGLMGGYDINQNYVVLLNGVVIGVVKAYSQFVDKFRQLRRKNRINQFVSISVQEKKRQILIASDSGRLTRPLIIVQNGYPLVQQMHITALKEKQVSFDDLVRIGLIEYLDVNEMDNSLIALSSSTLSNETSHLEIEPYSILGCVAGLIPFPHHNQSPRNTYQCAMGKQSIGCIGYNQFNRVDTVLYTMIYPQTPLVRTKTIEYTNYHKLPAGHNAMVAVMSYTGYDIEDAIILNKASLDRGYGLITQFRNYTTQFQINLNQILDGLAAPEQSYGTKHNHNMSSQKRQRALDIDGLAKVAEKLYPGDTYVNKVVPAIKQEHIAQMSHSLNNVEVPWLEQPTCLKGTLPMTVDRMILTSNAEYPRLVKTVLRQTRRPELGDKLSSRHGQKGVCGLIVNQEDMPFNELGMSPDLIMNPHGFPSRMTVGKMIELIAGKAGALKGQFKYGTAFTKDGDNDLKTLGEQLTRNGFNYSGKDCFISGVSGEYIQTYIFTGPIFYQRLKHMVADKIHARARGPTSNLTRQPTEGRARDGGLRLGEMERDCLIGYGAVNLIIERLMLASDLWQGIVCSKCGLFTYTNVCMQCNDKPPAYQITMPYACKLLFQELFAMGIKTKINLTT